MRREEIQVGARYTCRVGRNTVEVTVTAGGADGGWQVQTHTGRTMAIRDPERFVARAGQEAVANEPSAPATEPAAATPATPEAAAVPGETGRTMSLLDAAVHLLARAEGPMQCKDLVEQARAQGLWAPRRGGKTPDRTLYAAILREITSKGDAARFRKAERGRFALHG